MIFRGLLKALYSLITLPRDIYRDFQMADELRYRRTGLRSGHNSYKSSKEYSNASRMLHGKSRSGNTLGMNLDEAHKRLGTGPYSRKSND